MDNENKELDLETQDTGVTVDEPEFDPTESEDFYNNLEAAISGGIAVEEAAVAPEMPVAGTVAENANFEEASEASSSLEDELFAGVDAALAEQIEYEFGRNTVAGTVEEEPEEKKSLWAAIPLWTKILCGVILALLLAAGLLFGTKKGKAFLVDIAVEFFFKNANVEDEEPTPVPTPTDAVTPIPSPTTAVTPEPTTNPEQNPEATPEPSEGPTEVPTETPTPTVTPTPTIVVMDDENIINVLLLGEENMKNASKGRADVIILVSVNLNGGPLKMVSFQRDLWVNIPGYGNDRINAAYAKKNGARLTMETIEQNFGVDVDSYIKIGFDGFENLIDSLGGLEMSLTAKEAEYLTGKGKYYISKPEDRNVVAGKQVLTGSQVLGYCRVRYVETENGLKDDRGRNYRHRVVLQAIFNQYKNKNLTQLTSIMMDCFDYVTVPADLQPLAKKCLLAVVENKMFEIDTLQLPVSGKYSDVTVTGSDGTPKAVLMFYPENVDRLQEFIYGD